MKNRTFYATFLLFVLAIYAGLFGLSLVTLHDAVRQSREQCLSEQYIISSALYRDMGSLAGRALEPGARLESLVQPYLYLAGNRGAALGVYRDGRLLHAAGASREELSGAPARGAGAARTAVIERSGGRYYCSVSGALPEPFGGFQVLYRADITARINEWERRDGAMMLLGGLLSLALAVLLLLLLGRLFWPLSEITRLSRRIACGDYADRLPEQGRDETAMMARSFNHMASQIEGKVTELAAAAESRQRFIDNLAHELRTPLTAIYGYAQYLRSAALGEEETRFALDAILSESRRIQVMAGQLMELSGLRGGEIGMERQDLEKIVEALRSTLAQRLWERGIVLKVSLEVKTVTGDHFLLQSLLLNLIDNALKASGDNSAVAVTSYRQGGCPVIAVTDWGKGMEPQELERITQPYYRVDKARSRKDGGAGLGLAICLQIAQRHHARLVFRSAPGRGTTALVIFTAP